MQAKNVYCGLPIACPTTEGGRAFITAYRDEKVAHIGLLCKRLLSLDHLQDAYTILVRSISHKLVHLHAAWPACAEGDLGIQWFERADEVVHSTLADLLGVSRLTEMARVISRLPTRLTPYPSVKTARRQLLSPSMSLI